MNLIKFFSIFSAWIVASASELVDPVYQGILDTPYSLDSCDGKPNGCTNIVNTLQQFEKKLATLQNRLDADGGKDNGPKKSKAPKVNVKPGRPVELNEKNFTDFIKSSDKSSLVLFHAPWCGHCKNMMPDYDKLAGYMEDKTVNIVKVDATENEGLSRKFKVQGFPTLVFFPKGGKPETYRYGRDFDALVEFLKPHTKSAKPLEVRQLTGQEMLSSECGTSKCVITILPNLIDGGQSKGRKQAIESITKAINANREVTGNANYFWIEGGSNLDWEESLVGTLPYPTTFVLNLLKEEVVVYPKNNVSETGLIEFLRQSSRSRTQSFRKKVPALKTTLDWDGKDFITDEL